MMRTHERITMTPSGSDEPIRSEPSDREPSGCDGRASEPASRPYTAAEERADALVHAVGLSCSLVGTALLAFKAAPYADLPAIVGFTVYAIGAITMLGCSALYNLAPEGPRKQLFRRFDHAAIFLMIAGTYTPFMLVAIGDGWGYGMLALVWTVALAGMTVELLRLRRHDNFTVAAYLFLGWIALVALSPLSTSLSPTGIALLAGGGVLYSLGVIFHVWESLPFQNAIWHGFVLLGAACHYLAVLYELIF